MSKVIDKWKSTYKHLELTEDAINIFNNHFIPVYGDDIDSFVASYYQDIVDVENNVPKVGDEVYYVFGSYLNKGIIEYIEEFIPGCSVPRIKIKGKKKLVRGKAIFIIKTT